MSGAPLNLRANRTRAWLFTLNNWTEEEEHAIIDLTRQDSLRYIIFGRENAPTTGTPHLQGFVYFFQPKTFDAVKAFFQIDRIHLKRMTYGHTLDIINYCKKDQDFFEKGIPPAQGKRKDIDEMIDVLRRGVEQRFSFEEVIRHNPLPCFIRNYRGAREYYSALSGSDIPRTSKPTVYWLYGHSGTGKTRWCIRRCRGTRYWISSGSLRWFQGYRGQECAILDDLRPEDVSASFLLRLLDRYPVEVETKGSSCQWKPEFIYITSEQDPTTFFINCSYGSGDPRQLERRIDYTYSFDLLPSRSDLPNSPLNTQR